MPELPDVAYYKKYLDATSLHQVIQNIEINSTRIIKDDISDFQNTVKGKKFVSSERHGKYLFVSLDPGGKYLIMHFGMTGNLEFYTGQDEQPEFTQIAFGFGEGRYLAFIMPRKLGAMYLRDSVNAFIEEKELGPDVFGDDFDFDRFLETLSGRRGMIKSRLMDQEIMAGIGNVYSDEILFQAGIHPKTNVNKLTRGELKRVYESMQYVLKTAIQKKANPDEFPPDFIIPVRDEGEDCPRCSGTVKNIKVSGRSGYYCPECQPRKS